MVALTTIALWTAVAAPGWGNGPSAGIPSRGPSGPVVRGQSPEQAGGGILPQFNSLFGSRGNAIAPPPPAPSPGQAASGFPGNPITPPANSPTPAPSQPLTEAMQRALQATVRLKVEDSRGQSVATGTIVDAHGGEVLIVTCGHVFRESGGKGRILVDLFVPGAGTSLPGEMLDFDLLRDIGLVSVRPNVPVRPIRVGDAQNVIDQGHVVFSVGCDRGERPQVKSSQLTGINRYKGPPNFVAAGAPAEGRSGGGLFSESGLLIGVCNAADTADDEGIYAALPTIHWQLDQIGQERVYGGRPLSEPSALAQSESPNRAGAPNYPPATPIEPRTSEPMLPPTAPRPTQVDPRASQVDPNVIATAWQQGSEGVLLLRSQRDPSGPPEIVRLDRLSPELRDRLIRELSPVPPPGATATYPAVPGMAPPSMNPAPPSPAPFGGAPAPQPQFGTPSPWGVAPSHTVAPPPLGPFGRPPVMRAQTPPASLFR